MTSQDDIKKMLALCEKATPGPWDSSGYAVRALEDSCPISTLFLAEYGTAADAEFIAQARTALPALLRVVGGMEQLLMGYTSTRVSAEMIRELVQEIWDEEMGK